VIVIDRTAIVFDVRGSELLLDIEDSRVKVRFADEP